MSTGYHLSPHEKYPEQPPLLGVPPQEPKTLQQKLNEAKKIKANLQAKINAKKQDPQPPNTENKKGGKRKNRTHKRKGRKSMTRRRR